MPGQLATYVPLDGHREAHQRTEPRGVDAVFVGFAESHGIIYNSALLIPLEAILTRVGSVRPIQTKDFKIGAEKVFPLARLREWTQMLRSARLVANCSADEYRKEVGKLCDISTPYSPSVIF